MPSACFLAAHVAVVGAGARLGDGERAQGPAGLHVRVHALLDLLGRAELHDVEHGERVLVQDVVAAARAVQLLDHEAQRDLVGRNAAVLLGNAHEAEAHIAVRLGDLVGHVLRLVHLLDDVLGEVPLAELAHALEQELLLVGQRKVHLVLRSFPNTRRKHPASGSKDTPPLGANGPAKIAIWVKTRRLVIHFFNFVVIIGAAEAEAGARPRRRLRRRRSERLDRVRFLGG